MKKEVFNLPYSLKSQEGALTKKNQNTTKQTATKPPKQIKKKNNIQKDLLEYKGECLNVKRVRFMVMINNMLGEQA